MNQGKRNLQPAVQFHTKCGHLHRRCLCTWLILNKLTLIELFISSKITWVTKKTFHHATLSWLFQNKTYSTWCLTDYLLSFSTSDQSSATIQQLSRWLFLGVSSPALYTSPRVGSRSRSSRVLCRSIYKVLHEPSFTRGHESKAWMKNLPTRTVSWSMNLPLAQPS